jgi:hypothetical protein
MAGINPKEKRANAGPVTQARSLHRKSTGGLWLGKRRKHSLD